MPDDNTPEPDNIIVHDFTAHLKSSATTPGRRRRVSSEQSLRFVLHISLNDIDPPVWRRIETADITLFKLDQILRLAFDWPDEETHLFDTSLGFFSGAGHDLNNRGYADHIGDQRRVRLHDLFPDTEEDRSLTYIYDVDTERWQHRCRCETILKADRTRRLPRCLDAAGRPPFLQIGGAEGYQDFIDALLDPHDPRHEDARDIWDDFWPPDSDPAEIDAQAIDMTLHRYALGMARGQIF